MFAFLLFFHCASSQISVAMLLASVQKIAEMAGGSVNTASVWVCDAKQWWGRRWRRWRRRGGCVGRSGGPGDSDECVIMEVRASSGGWGGSAALPLLWLCFLQVLWALGVGAEEEAEWRQQGASD